MTLKRKLEIARRRLEKEKELKNYNDAINKGSQFTEFFKVKAAKIEMELEQMAIKIKPCPFCGNDPTIHTTGDIFVNCSNELCGAFYQHSTIEQWNSRGEEIASFDENVQQEQT